MIYDLVLNEATNKIPTRITNVCGPLPKIGETINHLNTFKLKIENIIYHTQRTIKSQESYEISNIEVLVKYLGKTN